MKKSIVLALLATFALFSCSRDISPDEQKRQIIQKNRQFWDIVGKLVDIDQITPDYEGKTFTPVIGEPADDDPTTRIVAVNSLIGAVNRYNNLTGESIDENTASHSFSLKDVGSLNYRKVTDNSAWAIVDVSIPAVPTLSRIIYRSPEQGDTNGSVGDNGSAYYRFGDVIKRTRAEDDNIEYWICVRPAFGPEGKGDSHWVSVSPLPESNLWPYCDEGAPFTASNGMNYSLPYNLRDDTEWMQDFAELLYAIHHPVTWSNNIDNNYSEGWFGPNGQLMFHDFHKDKKEFHNIGFWDNVRKGWEQHNVYSMVFGKSQSYFSQITSSGGAGLYCLYNGHSWWTFFENSPTLYQAHYSPDSDDITKHNMYNVTYSKVSHQVVEPDDPNPGANNFPLDFHAARSYEQPYFVKREFFGDNHPRWIIRYATGKELATDGNWNPQFRMVGCEDVYRYYRDILPDKILTQQPEITDIVSSNEEKYAGNHGYFLWGSIYRDEEGSYWLCYFNWYNYTEEVKTKDHYARFISFDKLKTTTQTSDFGSGKFYTSELIPQREAPLALAILMSICGTNPNTDANNAMHKNIRQKIKQFSNYDVGVVLVRDTLCTVDNNGTIVNIHGNIDALSLMYEPEYGLDEGEQPYLRMIKDASKTGPERTQLAKMAYDVGHFYTEYNVPGDHPLGRYLMDLTDLFSINPSNNTIPADKWSRCARSSNGQRDGDFKPSDRYKVSFDASLFMTKPTQYVSAYHEPVIAPRFMMIDDPWTDRMPTEGIPHTLTEVYRPYGNEDSIMQNILAVDGALQMYMIDDDHCFMNGRKYKIDK